MQRLKPCLRYLHSKSTEREIRELSQRMKRTPQRVSAEEAVKSIPSNSTVFIGSGAGVPTVLLDALIKHAVQSKLTNVKLFHMNIEGAAEYASKDYEHIFRNVSFFVSPSLRSAVAEGRADYIPIFAHKISQLFEQKIIVPDFALVHVSSTDQHGYCSLGVSVSIVHAALKYSKVIIAQVNPKMPRTFGDGIIHSSHFDTFVKVEKSLPIADPIKQNFVDVQIAKLIVENLVDDGSTLQLCSGSISEAVLSQLSNHKDLGIHSDELPSGIVGLSKKGAITNAAKPLHRGRSIASYVNGTQELYDYVNNNPFVELYRIEHVASPRTILQLPKMTSINSAIQIDLFGQVCVDSIGTKIYSGYGSYVDFITGAMSSKDGLGKAIIALPSVNTEGLSNIVPMLPMGTSIVTPRAHVQYLVTEFGIANLFGKTLRQRACSLINIAHPDHRDSLEKKAYEILKCMPCLS